MVCIKGLNGMHLGAPWYVFKGSQECIQMYSELRPILLIGNLHAWSETYMPDWRPIERVRKDVEC